MTVAQADTVRRLAGHLGVVRLEINLKPGLVWSLPEGYIALTQHFQDGHAVDYGISTLGEASS